MTTRACRSGFQAVRDAGHRPLLRSPPWSPLPVDRTGLLTAVLGQLAELPPVASYIVLGYLLIRLLIPVLLIALAARGATPAQRIGLVRDYLTYWTTPRRRTGRRRSSARRRPARRTGSS
jgi:hypothetical protein